MRDCGSSRKLRPKLIYKRRSESYTQPLRKRAKAMFLTDDELRKLTGLKRRKAQVAWLRSRRIRHYVNALGFPVVALTWLDSGADVVILRARPNLSVIRKQA